MAPYQHIEKDLKSLKEVVEMKNQQIHQQEKKISDLEKVVGSNKLSHTHKHTQTDAQKQYSMNITFRCGCVALLSRPKRTCSWRRESRFCSSRMKTC